MGAPPSWLDPPASGVYTEKNLCEAKKIDKRGSFHLTGEKQRQKHCMETEINLILLINEQESNSCHGFSTLGEHFAQHNFDKSCWSPGAPRKEYVGQGPTTAFPHVHPVLTKTI